MFFHKKSNLANRDRREKEDAKNEREKIDTTTFVELPDPFEQEIDDDLLRNQNIRKQNIPIMTPRLRTLKLLKQNHRPQTMNFLN